MDLSTLQAKRKDLKIFSIEGNIGAGKSTLIKALKEKYNLEVVSEPTEIWQDYNGMDMLNEMYRDMKGKTALFQVFALYTRIQKLIETVNTTTRKIIVVERAPPFCDYHVFTKYNLDIGNINEYGFNVYEGLYKMMLTNFECLIPDKFIYIDSDVDTCMERIKIRNRESEANVTRKYLQGLELHYSRMLPQVKDYSIVKNNNLDKAVDEIYKLINN